MLTLCCNCVKLAALPRKCWNLFFGSGIVQRLWHEPSGTHSVILSRVFCNNVLTTQTEWSRWVKSSWLKHTQLTALAEMWTLCFSRSWFPYLFCFLLYFLGKREIWNTHWSIQKSWWNGCHVCGNDSQFSFYYCINRSLKKRGKIPQCSPLKTDGSGQWCITDLFSFLQNM